MRLLILVLLAVTGMANAASDPDPIEKGLYDCLRKAMSRAESDVCQQAALDSWQSELNSLQNQVAGKLSPEERAVLEQAHVKWLMYRDAEFKNLDVVSAGGWAYDPFRWSIKHELVKGRIAVLDGYRRLIKMMQ